MTDAYLINASTKYSALPSASPFNLAFNTNQPFFNWLESGGNEMRLKRFGKAMTGTAGYSDGDSFSSTKGMCLKIKLLICNLIPLQVLTGLHCQKAVL
jgi:hypothetical protein